MCALRALWFDNLWPHIFTFGHIFGAARALSHLSSRLLVFWVPLDVFFRYVLCQFTLTDGGPLCLAHAVWSSTVFHPNIAPPIKPCKVSCYTVGPSTRTRGTVSAVSAAATKAAQSSASLS